MISTTVLLYTLAVFAPHYALYLAPIRLYTVFIQTQTYILYPFMKGTLMFENCSSYYLQIFFQIFIQYVTGHETKEFLFIKATYSSKSEF